MEEEGARWLKRISLGSGFRVWVSWWCLEREWVFYETRDPTEGGGVR